MDSDKISSQTGFNVILNGPKCSFIKLYKILIITVSVGGGNAKKAKPTPAILNLAPDKVKNLAFSRHFHEFLAQKCSQI